jgi:K(+)-stimulated pyrophosphate-energized sodium pump
MDTFPLILRSFGIFASMVGIFFAQMRNSSEDPMKALNRGYYVSALLAVGFWALST